MRGNSLICYRCKSVLNVGARYDVPSRAEKWTNHCIEELIHWTSEQPNRILRRSWLLDFIGAVGKVDKAETRKYQPSREHRHDFVRYMAWRDANVPTLNLRPNTSRVDLGDLLKAAARQCVSVLDMLLRPEESASAVLPGVQYGIDVPQGREDCKDEWMSFSKMVDALIADADCYLPSMQELIRTSQVRGYRKGRVPGHFSRYSVQLRMQRALHREIAPHRINTAFRQAVRHLRQGVRLSDLANIIQRQFLLSDEASVRITHSAAIIYNFQSFSRIG